MYRRMESGLRLIAWIVVLGSTCWTVVCFGGFDGGGWIGARSTLVGRQWQGLALIPGLAAAVGIAIGVTTGLPRRFRWLGIGGTAVVIALGDASIGSNPAIEALYALPDWARIPCVVGAGIATAAGLGWARRERPTPAWLIAAIAGAPLIVTAVLSGQGFDLVALALMVLTGCVLGRSAWRLIHGGVAPDAPLLVLVGLGWTIYGLLVLTLALVGIALQAALFTLPPLILALCREEVGLALRTTRRWLSTEVSWSATEWLVAGSLAGLLLVVWITAVSPELGPDALGGRIALPAIWLREGLLNSHPEIALSYMGLAAETHFLAWLPWAGENTARLTAVVCAALVSVWLTGLAVRAGGKAFWGMLAAALFFSSTVVLWQFLHGFVDLLQAFFASGAFCALAVWLERRTNGALVAAGLLAGTATAVKLNGAAAVIACLSVVAVVVLARTRNLVSTARSSILLGGSAAVVVLPWLVRSWWLTGNPVFPFANGVFKSPLAPLELVAKRYGETDFLGWWRIPWDVVATPGRFVELGSVHPLWPGLILVIVAAVCGRDRSSRLYAAAALISATLWLITEQNLRYLLAALLACTATVAAWSARSPSLGHPAARWSALGLVAAGAMLSLARPSAWMWAISDGPGLPLSLATGRETAETYRARLLPTAPVGDFLNRSEPDARRVWLLPWQRDHLSFRAPVIALPHGDNRLTTRVAALLPNAPEIDEPSMATGLSELGVSHLVFDISSPWTLSVPSSRWPGIYGPEFRHARLDLLFASGDLWLCRLRNGIRTEDEWSSWTVPATERRNLLASGADSGAIALKAGEMTSRNLQVEQERLYAFELTLGKSASAEKGFLQLFWKDANGAGRRFQRFSFPDTKAPEVHHIYQNAPKDATHVEVTLAGPVSIDVLEWYSLPETVRDGAR